MTRPNRLIVLAGVFALAIVAYLYVSRRPEGAVANTSGASHDATAARHDNPATVGDSASAPIARRGRSAERTRPQLPAWMGLTWKDSMDELLSTPESEWDETIVDGQSRIRLSNGVTVIGLPRKTKRILPDVLTSRELAMHHPEEDRDMQVGEGEAEYQILKCGEQFVKRRKPTQSVSWKMAVGVRAAGGWGRVVSVETPNWPGVFDEEAKRCYTQALRVSKWRTTRTYDIRVEYPLCIIIPGAQARATGDQPNEGE